MRGLLKSLRQTIRQLLKAPGFTITAVVILGFGIGANTAIFSVIDGVLLKPLPYPEPDQLVQFYLTYQGREDAIDYPDYLDICAAQHSLDSLSIVSDNAFDLTGKGDPERLDVDFMSASMFKVTGRPCILGRSFSENEDVPGGPLVVVLSEAFWRSRFNSDPSIIGANLTLSDHSFQVIGVAPAQINYWSPCDVYVPISALQNFGSGLWKRNEHIGACFGRLKAGVGLAQAQADLDSIHNNLIARYPDTNKGYGIRVVALRDYMVADYSANVWLLGGAVACLLLISCANIANLQFARGLERRKEMTVRAALGAVRLRLAGHLLLESAVLSFLGGICGLFIAWGTIEIIKELSAQSLYRIEHRFQEVNFDARALLFVFTLTALTSLLAGILPALSLSKVSLAGALKDGGSRAGTMGPERQRLQSALVIGQIALASVLLVGTGLMVRSFVAAQSAPLGFDPGHIITAELWLRNKRYESDGERTRAFWDALLEKIRRLPSVSTAAMNDFPPFYWGDLDWGAATAFGIVGQPDLGPGNEPKLDWHTISPGYFQLLHIPLLQGRDFDAQDKVTSQNVVIINESLRQRFFPDQDALGQQIRINDGETIRTCTIVGVVPHLRYNSPDYAERPFQAYFPYTQYNFHFQVLLLRSSRDPSALIPSIRNIVASIDSTVPVVKVGALDDLIAKVYGARKRTTLLVGTFSGVALILSAVGLYGTLAYSIGQRTREIGVRVALGAQSSNILGLIVRQGIKLVCIGLAAGMVTALLLVRFISSTLYGVSGDDPVTLVSTVLVLGTAALLACLLPALRATRIDPITALRE